MPPEMHQNVSDFQKHTTVLVKELIPPVTMIIGVKRRITNRYRSVAVQYQSPPPRLSHLLITNVLEKKKAAKIPSDKALNTARYLFPVFME
jgi:hypothetical protein